MSVFHVPVLIFLAATSFGWGGYARAQDLPPVAAPTTSVEVMQLPVVQTESQQIGEFAGGLLRSLTATENIRAAAIAVVRVDHIDLANSFGLGGNETGTFALGSLTDLFFALSAMQMVEQARLLPDEDISRILGEDTPRGVTLAGLLTLRGGDSGMLRQAVARAAGTDMRTYVATRILNPLAMTRTVFDGAEMHAAAADMGRLIVALANDGAADGGRILLPETLGLMMRTHDSTHQAMPGRTYGFAEMQRNGWRALQRDGRRSVQPQVQSRLVVVPEARSGYFVAVEGDASPQFWRALDGGLFDRLFPHRALPGDLRTGPAPDAGSADAAAGLYRIAPNGENAMAFLRADDRIEVQGGADGTLLVAGSEDLTLLPAPGGFWRAAETMVPAAYSGGILQIGNIAYRRIPPWQQAWFFAALAGLGGICTLALYVFGTRFAPSPVLGTLRRVRIGLAGLTFVFLATAVVLQALA